MSFTSNFRVQPGKPVIDTDYSTLSANWTAIQTRLNNKNGLVYRTTDNLSVGTGTTTISWEAANLDTSSFWSGGAATRLTIPSGIAYARLGAGFRFTASVSDLEIKLLKNGAVIIGQFDQRQPATNIQAFSAPLAVSAADYFEVQVVNTSGSGKTLRSIGTWFGIEVWGS